MAKSKIKTTKRLGVLLAAVGIATVLLASYTLARFSTSAGGGGTSSIALWDVTITPQTNTTLPSSFDSAVSFGKLSPGTALTETEINNSKVQTGESTYNYYIVDNETSSKQLVTLDYDTSVDLKFIVSTSEFTINFKDGSIYNGTTVTDSGDDTAADYVSKSTSTLYKGTKSEGGDAITSSNYTITSSHAISSNPIPCYNDIVKLFELDIVYYDEGSVSGVGTSLTKDTDGDYCTFGDGSGTNEGTKVFYGTLSWQVIVTDYESSNNYYWATYLCDWVGKYVESVSCSFTYTARQASDTGS